jgi:hypothetical protein
MQLFHLVYVGMVHLFEIALIISVVLALIWTLNKGVCLLGRVLDYIFPTYWTGIDLDPSPDMSPNPASAMFHQPTRKCRQSPVQMGLILTTRIVTRLLCVAVFAAAIVTLLVVWSNRDNEREQEKERLQQELKRAATELELRKLEKRRAKGKGKAKLEEEDEWSKVGHQLRGVGSPWELR